MFSLCLSATIRKRLKAANLPEIVRKPTSVFLAEGHDGMWPSPASSFNTIVALLRKPQRVVLNEQAAFPVRNVYKVLVVPVSQQVTSELSSGVKAHVDQISREGMF